MAKYANGTRSQAISDRSGQAFPYQEMVTEWNGSFVHISEFEEKHPQIRRKRRVLVFNPPRGARTFHHTSKLYQSVSRQRIILILLLIRREHSDLI